MECFLFYCFRQIRNKQETDVMTKLKYTAAILIYICLHSMKLNLKILFEKKQSNSQC